MLPERPTIVAEASLGPAPATNEAKHPLTSLPQLSSRPESTNILLLDFDGHTYTGTRWSNGVNPDAPIVTPVFSLDSDYQTFTDSELNAIQEVWARVSEDFAPFDVNVTTIDPGTTRMSQKYAQRCCIGGSNQDWYNRGAGGVAYINSFQWEQDEICFAFAGNFWGNTHNIAAVTSHELGHTLGLHHQSLWVNSVKEQEYRPGTGEGILRHGAIMGNSYGTYSDTWYNGLTPSQREQDDISVLSNVLSHAVDDHGDSSAEATPLNDFALRRISGVIHSADDVDYFAINVSQGSLSVKATPAGIGPNLDGKLELWDSTGTRVAQANPTATLSASIQTNVSAGTYYLSVATSGIYGKIGTYHLALAQPGVGLDKYTIDENEQPGSVIGQLILVDSAEDSAAYVRRVKSIAAGYRHSLFLKQDTGIWATGSNQNGALGNGTRDQKSSPILMLDTNAAGVAAGTYHSMTLRQDGSVWSTGNDFYGELGNGPHSSLQTFPVRVCKSGAVDISTQTFHGLILRKDGSVLGMGRNDYGQLGNGTTTNQPSAIPVLPSGVSAISAGGYHSMFLKTDGTLWVTGRNDQGQLGDNSTENKSSPVQIDTGVAAIEAGEFHSLYVKTDGTLWAMGKNSHGQLGDGTNIDRQTPVQITSIEGEIAALAAGGDHTLIVKADGSMWAMGRNDYGQLGLDSTANVLTPQRILQTGVQDVAAGSHHSILLMADGSVKAMGRNHYGQLGDTTKVNKSSPVTVFSTGGGLSTADEVFSFAEGDGDTDNDLFSITGNQLSANHAFDHETKDSYSIRVQGVAGSRNRETVLLIRVNDLNEPHTDISLSNSEIEENLPAATSIGDLLVTDPDERASHTFELTESNTYPDNQAFTIDGNTLKAAVSFDYETKDSYQIKVEATDEDDLSVSAVLTVTILDGNELPILAEIDNQTTEEDVPLSITLEAEVFANGPVTYTAKVNTGQVETSFAGNIMTVTPAPNWNGDANISVTIEDSAEGTDTQSFDLTVSPVNDPAIKILINNHSIEENKASGALIGTLSAIDPEHGDTHMFHFLDFQTYPDNASFSITGDKLYAAAIFDYEAKSSYQVQVEAIDNKGAKYAEEISIEIQDVNDPPTIVRPHYQEILEDTPFTLDLFANDQDADPLTFSPTGTPFLNVSISGTKLTLSPVQDWHGDTQFTLKVTDGKGGMDEQTYGVTVLPVNDQPSNITLDNKRLLENQPSGTLIGEFTVTDVDEGDTHTLYLNDEEHFPDNQFFSIQGNQLFSTRPMNYEFRDLYKIHVIAYDKENFSVEKTFHIRIRNENEPSESVHIAFDKIAEGHPNGSLVTYLLTSDPDFNEKFTYRLVSGEGSDDNSAFTIQGNKLLNTQRLNREEKGFYFIRIQSTDSAGNRVEDNFALEIVDMSENQAPNSMRISNTRVEENLNPGTEVASFTSTDVDAGSHAEGIGTFSLIHQKYTTLIKADLDAKKKGGHPAVVLDEAEWRILRHQVGRNHLLFKNILMGATDEQSEGVWNWITGEPFLPFNWMDGQPDNGENLPISGEDSFPGENHLILSDESGYHLQWNDIDTASSPTDYYLLEEPAYYELVPGKGDNDNYRYRITGNRLVVAESANFEEHSTHSIRMRVTDFGGLHYETIFTLYIQDLPERPHNLTINTTEVEENLPARTAVATFEANDQDAKNKHLFMLKTQTDAFYILRNTLYTNRVLDFETEPEHTLRIEIVDLFANQNYIRNVTLNLLDNNDLPTELTLSSTIVPENAPVGTVIATLSASDPDANQTHTYQVVGGADKSYFRTKGDLLTTTRIIDFESTPSLEVILRVTDNQKGYIDVPFTIEVEDLNDTPTAIELSNTTFPENLASGERVLDFTSIDQDYTFKLIEGSFTWEEAYIDALQRGGEPATFSSSMEWGQMTTDIGVLNIAGQSLWLGASDLDEEGVWRWVDGSLMSYTRWANPKYVVGLNQPPPDNRDGIEHHLSIMAETGTRLEWNDRNSDSRLDGYIIECPNTYELVPGKGDTENHDFQIVGNQLQMVNPADFETHKLYFIRVMVTDRGGSTYENSFRLNVTDAPDTPTSIYLSNNEVPENEPRGFLVGTLHTDDADTGERFTYKLSSPADADNALFYISRDRLHTNQSFDYEDRSEYTVRVQVTDKDQLTYTRNLDLTITNENDPPTAIRVENPYVEENLTRGTIISTLIAEDPDPNERHTFAIIGGKDAHHAYVKRDILYVNEAADFETRKTLELLIEVTDIGRACSVFPVELQVVDANDTPTDILLDNLTLKENLPAGTVVGNLSIVDEDVWDSATFELAQGPGDYENSYFMVEGNRLKLAQPLNYEEHSTYGVRIRGMDEHGEYTEQVFTIFAIDVPDQPLEIYLSENGIPENEPVGFYITDIWADDEDEREKFTFTLPEGENDNALFYIKRDGLYTNDTFDYETKEEYTVTIQVTDKDKLTLSQDFPLFIADHNDAPHNLILDNTTILENEPRGTIIGTLTGEDQDPIERFSYRISGGLDAGSAYIKGNTLYSNEPFDFEAQSSINLKIEVLDRFKEGTEFDFQIEILDANDAPTEILLDNATLPENQPSGTVVGSLSSVDQDKQDNAFFALVSGIGDDHNDFFTIEDNQLLLASPLNFEEEIFYSIRVQAADSGAETVESVIEIETTDAPDAPTVITLSNDTIAEDTPNTDAIGILSAEDEDDRENHTFTFAESPQVPSDNALFQILKTRSGTTLKAQTHTEFDFDTKPEYNLYIQVTDKDQFTYTDWLTVYLTNVNEAPTDIESGSVALKENLPAGSEIGSLAILDEDLANDGLDLHTWLLVKGEGSSNNLNFKLDRSTGKLTTTKVFDHESETAQTIRVKVIDGAKNIIEKVLTIPIINANDEPTSLSISPTRIEMEEQQPTGTFVGTLSATDPDTADPVFNETLSYSLVSGNGDTHNPYFSIEGDQVSLNSPIIQKDIPTASFLAAVTDKAGASYTQAFTVTILDRNDPPTDISLDNHSIRENKPFGTLVGNLSANDPDAEDNHTFTLVSGTGDAGNGHFFIQNGNQLVSNALFDYEESALHYILVQVTDKEGATYTKSLKIHITDEANEIPRFQLTVDRIPSDGGLTSGAGLYDEDSTATLSATAGPGYTFAGWTGNLPQGSDAGDKELNIVMDSDKTLTAYFAKSFHTVNVSVAPERHGYASGGGSILSGTEITITAEELEGEDLVPFSHWRINGEDRMESTDKQLTLEVNENLTIEAVFDMGLPGNFVLVPAGSIVRDYKSKYEHTASVSAFYTSTHETSKEEWYKVYNWAIENGYVFEFDPINRNGRNRSHVDPSYENNFPITGITWNDMIKWCNARSEMERWTPLYYTDENHTTPHREDKIDSQETSPTAEQVLWRDRGYRLPTELEWEHAARGGIDYLDYPNGNTIDQTQAFYNQRTSTIELDYTTQSSRVPNGFGLYDMVGHAWEACWDWYSKTWYANELAHELDNKGPSLQQTGIDRNYRTARGGDSYSDHRQLKISNRTVIRTWFNYGITLRPVFPAPSEPDATVTLATSQAHLGNVSGGGIYQIGSTATLVATPETGAVFKEWQDQDGNILGSSTTLSLTIQGNTTISAVFEDNSGNPPMYTLQTFAEPGENGSVSGTGAYLADSTVQITGTPIEGLDFVGWAGDAFGTYPTLSIKITQNLEITGAFGDTSIDTDKDGLADLYEDILGSSPFEADSDGDSLSDGDEVNRYASNPSNTDTDGDGHDDHTEALANTSLTDPNDFPFIPEKDLARYFIFKGKPYDYSGNKGHGTSTDVTYIADRWDLNNNAYAFNGTSSFVEATNYNGVTGSGARAISGWVRTTSGNSGPLVAYGISTNLFSIHINNTGVIEVYADTVTLTGNTNLTDNAWHQFLFSVPEGGTIADIRIYIDGQQESTTANGNTAVKIATSSNSAVLIGKDAENNFFTGDIDEIRLWKRNLVATEADKLHDLEVYKEPDTIRPTIQEHPATQTVAAGDSATFTIRYKAKPAPTFQWEKLVGRTYQTLKGETGESLTLTDIEEEDATNYRVKVTNSEGSVYSSNAKLIVYQRPAITEAPQDIALLVNRGGKIYTRVTGSPKLTYEWFKDESSLGNSKGNYWFIPKTANQQEHGGVYSFKVTNAVGEVTSAPFTVSILEAVVITTNPVPTGIISGQSGALTVEATGGGTISYQWKKYDSSSRKYLAIEGATQSTYRIQSMTTSDEGIYQCEVTNGASTLLSRTATLTMYVPPSFKTHPGSFTFEEFAPVTMMATALGTPAPAYIWQKFNEDTHEWEDQLKYKSSTYYLKKSLVSHAGTYRVKATNPGGLAYSNEAELIIHYKPVITKDLEIINANEGTNVTITIEAEALDRKGNFITYHWYHNNENVVDGNGISGAQTPSLQLSSVDIEDGGTYYCILSNSVGETRSRAMKLIVIQKPYSTSTSLRDLTLNQGNSLSLSAIVRGGQPLTLQWYQDGKLIEGADKSKLYFSFVSSSHAGEYSLVATNPAGSLTLTGTVTITGNQNASAANILAGVDTQTPDHDADGDGLPNLLEQALGSDPANPHSTYSPTLDIVEDGTGQQYLAYHFTQNNSATNLTTHIEVSTDLITWEPLDLNEATLTTLDHGDLTQTTLYLPATNAQRFLRLRVEK